MACTELNTQVRAQEKIVKKPHRFHLIKWMLRLYQLQKIPHIRTVTARQAHDIGIGPAELERHQHRLPSQHSHHPRG